MKNNTAVKSAKKAEPLDSVTSNTGVATVEALAAPETVKPLTEAERKQLANYEETINQGITGFKKVAEALLAINVGRLYREEFKTFQEYCRVKWDFTARHANRLMLAGNVVKNIESDQLVSSVPTAVPENEAQTRPLQSLPAQQQVAACRIVAQNPGKQTTKSFVNAADKVTGKIPKEEKSTPPSTELGDEKPRVQSYTPTTPDKDIAQPNGDLEKLVELLDQAQTQARKIVGCADVAKALGELAKQVTRKLNGGGK